MNQLLNQSLILGLIVLSASGFMSEKVVIGKEEALAIARKTPEVEAFYQLLDGQLADCIRSRISDSCDSPLVTCLEDAWVIEYFLDDTCPARPATPAELQDPSSKMRLVLVLNGINGKFISKFPEKEYISDSDYCLEAQACIPRNEQGSGCINFFQAAVLGTSKEAAGGRCHCVNNRCVEGS